jgi:hypothetical protein
MVWGKEPLTVNQRWIKQANGTYDFDVTKADKLFEFLVKEGRIKLPEGHSMLRPDEDSGGLRIERTGVDRFDLKMFEAGVNSGTKSLLSRN